MKTFSGLRLLEMTAFPATQHRFDNRDDIRLRRVSEGDAVRGQHRGLQAAAPTAQRLVTNAEPPAKTT
ncbi:hypothetical protein L3Q65_43985 [Amycolatopsis sp. FU40]|uniref:hypothetical protein n=1 Tax=Amycolatopsis sp. FU40 TaxID=2914159 RepID=UPI001F38AE44|nr:hypothetical protein [Amycolatopsis sp. FU40]UKD54748.1 hypothetical protein L3Q65_43985 [Amycolatopsis sp. FU40]